MASVRLAAGRDVGVALAAVAVAVLLSVQAAGAQGDARPLDAPGYGLVVVAAGALAWRRAAPVAALAVSVLANGGYLLAGYPYGPGLLCVGWAMFEVAWRRPIRRSAPLAAGAAVVSVAAVLPRLAGELDILALGLVLWGACWLAVPWSLGALLHVRAAAERRAREELMARAALEERVRISREVHDVAGHGFAVIAMQAGVALVVLDEQPAQARASLEGIRAAATAALGDLRRVLDERGPRPEPAPDLPALVARARTAGLAVELRGGADDLPTGVRDVVYQVVREALTNVIRHAGPTGAVVAVTREPGGVLVTVTDHGVGAAVVPAQGRGLAGLRQRVEAAGGTFTAAGLDGGGFEVRARLPVHGDAA
ncbi:two-component sensor histidine kinase [Dactylosporangium aurantiacum]|uniref:histidine kinase n=1 Tax=Dactylosporangium aurantiacum TaxID=35754 RepID=A0A9Q9ILW4_9ACTN|nr:histidine kinase [Dactylosporangium aurantiacum]MDG6109933.1 histidine kinase [Dactylosporangium aurantiacum]UWZ58071.1 two-component sensor histidine kinase [Dactylosporangium aurantiacum]